MEGVRGPRSASGAASAASTFHNDAHSIRTENGVKPVAESFFLTAPYLSSFNYLQPILAQRPIWRDVPVVEGLRVIMGDTLVVWKLDRLSRSLSDLLRILEQVDKAGATFKSLTESLDISGACGRLMMHMLAAFNQFEREIIRERTKAGLDYARSQGRIGGGRPKLTDEQRKQAISWIQSFNQARRRRLMCRGSFT
jgi:hypothetical protein